MKKSKIETLKQIGKFILLCLGFFSFFMVLYYTIFIAKGYYHADCTDTLMWAQASYDAKALMNPDFAYAGLIPFGGQLIMLPFVALFGVGMKAQIIGMAIFCVLFTIAIIFFCKSIGFDFKWISITVTTVLILVSASEKLREIFWEHIIYYSLGVFFLMIGFALVVKCIKTGNSFFIDDKVNKLSLKKLIIPLCILFVWTTLCSMNGVQSLTIYGIPVMGAIIAERFFDFQTSFLNKKNYSCYLVISVMILGIAAGLLLGKLANGDISAWYADAYSVFSPSDEWVDNLLKFFPEFFTLLGVKLKDHMMLYSIDGVFNLLRIICAMILLVVPVVMAILYKKFDDISYRLMIFIHHFLSFLILLGWVFGILSSANWRLSPIVVTSAILCVMFIKWILEYVDYKRLAAIVIIPIVCMLLITTKSIITMDRQTETNKELNELAEYLEENDLTYGYSTFWQANIITMLSDSKVKVRGINLDEDGYAIRLYQTNKNWYENNGYRKYFTILSNYEYTEYFVDNENFEEPETILEFGNYMIMVYDHNIF